LRRLDSDEDDMIKISAGTLQAKKFGTLDV
jgi:hypothetical protein